LAASSPLRRAREKGSRGGTRTEIAILQEKNRNFLLAIRGETAVEKDNLKRGEWEL